MKPYQVHHLPLNTLDSTQPIFDSFRSSYEGFDHWMDKVVAEPSNRTFLAIIGDEGQYEAVALVKNVEQQNEYQFSGPVTKISTFKVGSVFRNEGRGQALLNEVLHGVTLPMAYMEVFPTEQELVSFLTKHGFQKHPEPSAKGELVFTYDTPVKI